MTSHRRVLRAPLFVLAAVVVAIPAAAAGQALPVGPSVTATPVAQGLTVPVFLTEPDDDSGRRFIVDQAGTIRILTQDDELLEEPFLDLADALVELNPEYDERGVLGLAFHPDYRENGRFFLYYSAPLRENAPEGWDHTSHVSEFSVSEDDPNRADRESERIILRVDQPYVNHNGGHIGFGRDGYLYVPLGDGGNAGDIDRDGEDLGRPERGHGQTITTLLGSILRIDVDVGDPYGIPDDNPFVGEDGADEIYAYGFRNPYGLSFDLETGDLYAADAGQALYEEVSRVERGGNYGWNIKEGTHCFDPQSFEDPPETCPESGPRGEPLIDPVVEYERGPETGSVIVAGVMYRGDRIGELADQFVFGDYSRDRFEPDGVLYAARPDGDGLWEVSRVRISNPLEGRDDGDLNRWVLGVTQDLGGELYVLTTRRGGPAGDTGEVLALGPAEDAEAAGEVERDDATAALPWWAWLAIAGAIAAALALAIIARRRRRGDATQG